MMKACTSSLAPAAGRGSQERCPTVEFVGRLIHITLVSDDEQALSLLQLEEDRGKGVKTVLTGLTSQALRSKGNRHFEAVMKVMQ